MSRLNYVAIMCREPERLRDFYTRWFGLEELQRSPAGTIYLTDGGVTVGLLPQGAAGGEADQRLGFHHYGLQIESIADIDRRLEEFGFAIPIERRPTDDPYAEYRLTGPDGLTVDLSEKGYGLGLQDEPRTPSIRHIATCADADVLQVRSFYHDVLEIGMWSREFKEWLTDRTADRNFAVFSDSNAPQALRPVDMGDGYLNLSLNRWRPDAERFGFAHIGFVVPDARGLMHRLAEELGTEPDERPADAYAEFRAFDPEGNALDLSQTRGWPVAPDRRVHSGSGLP